MKKLFTCSLMMLLALGACKKTTSETEAGHASVNDNPDAPVNNNSQSLNGIEVLALKFTGSPNIVAEGAVLASISGYSDQEKFKLVVDNTLVASQNSGVLSKLPVQVSIVESCPGVVSLSPQYEVVVSQEKMKSYFGQTCTVKFQATKGDISSNPQVIQIVYHDVSGALPSTPTPVASPVSTSITPTTQPVTLPTSAIVAHTSFMALCNDVGNANAQVMVKAIRIFLGTGNNGSGVIDYSTASCAEVDAGMRTKTEVILSYQDFKNLEPLFDFPNIANLSIVGGSIEKINGIEAMVNLQKLSLANNLIQDFSSLSKLSLLSDLNLSNNIGAINLAQLVGVKLSRLVLSGSKVNNLNELSKIPTLKHLDLSNVQVDDAGTKLSEAQLPFLNTLASLSSLDISNNLVTTLDALAPLVSLQHLFANSNKTLVSIDALSALKSLETLNLKQATVLKNSTPILSLVNLKSLDLSYTGISGFVPTGLVGLRYLSVNDIPTYSLTPYPKLANLSYLVDKITPCPVTVEASSYIPQSNSTATWYKMLCLYNK